MSSGILISQRNIRSHTTCSRITFLFASKCKTILQTSNESFEVLLCARRRRPFLHFSLISQIWKIQHSGSVVVRESCLSLRDKDEVAVLFCKQTCRHAGNKSIQLKWGAAFWLEKCWHEVELSLWRHMGGPGLTPQRRACFVGGAFVQPW